MSGRGSTDPGRRWSIGIALLGGLALLAASCVAYPGGYGGGLGYYQPYGINYGGWGPGYGVAPFHDGYHSHGYHVAQGGHGFGGGRGFPSLPPRGAMGHGFAGGHGGGFHGGGAHAGGAHGGGHP